MAKKTKIEAKNQQGIHRQESLLPALPSLLSCLNSSQVIHLALIDRNGQIHSANATLAKSLKVEAEELPGQNFINYLTEPDGASLSQRLAGKEPFTDDKILLNLVNTDQVPYSLHFQIIPLTNDFLLLGEAPHSDNQALSEELIQLNNQLSVLSREAARKGRELSNALSELKRTQALLVHQEKMASLGQMTAGIAHEINNPLAFVLGNEELLQRDFKDLFSLIETMVAALPEIANFSPRLHAAIVAKAAEVELEVLTKTLPRKIAANREGLERVKNIILDLRNFSRLDEAEQKLCDLNEGISSTLRFLTPLQHEYGVTIATDLPPLPPLFCSPGPLNQAVNNIVANAIQASQPGQVVRVSTRREGDCYIIAITDQGPGIPAVHLDKIFDPFFTTKPVGSGTGLGLSIAHQVVTMQGGKIEIDCPPGAGTTVRILLPGKIDTNLKAGGAKGAHFLERQQPPKDKGAEPRETFLPGTVDALRDERSLLRSLLDSSTDLIYFKDRNGKYLGCNKASEAFTGLSEEEQIGKSDFDLFDREMAERIAKLDQEVLAKGVAIRTEEWVTTAAAQRLLLDIVKAPIYAGNGETIGLVGISRDITAIKQSQEELIKTRRLHAETEKLGKVGGWEFDIETMTQTWTEEVYRIHEVDMSYHPTVEKGLNFYTPASRPIIEEAIQQAIEHKTPFSVELEILTAKGNLKSVKAIGKVDPAQRTVFGFFQDITEQKQAELELKNNERRLSCLFDLSQHPFTNEQEFLDYALQEVLRLSDSKIGYIYFYSEEKRQFTLNTWSKEVMRECCVVGQQTIYDLDRTGIWGEAVRQRQPIIINDFPADNPLKKGVPEGHVTLRRFLTVPVLIDGMIVAVAGVANKESAYTDTDQMQLTLFMDAVWKITAQKRAEAEKLNLTAQLQQAQKIESIGRLAGGVAHDFNNMLSVILGHAELGIMRLDPSHPVFANLQEIRTATKRSADLTRQLLAFARKQTVAPKVIDLNDAVAGMHSMLQRLIGENLQLTWQPAANLWPVRIDPSQLDQIMANLCINARDAISGGGKIIIETANDMIAANDSKAPPYAAPGDYVKVDVSDNGKGMDKETLEHIFEPFFTTKDVGEGTGLGLATVYGIVRQNNGFIHVYSEPGTGTTFTIYLPRHQGQTNHLLPGEETIATRGKETILLVEDEPSILEITHSILTDFGYTVLKTNNPVEALRIAREHQGAIHLLITDVIMPEMNGRELANNLLSLYPHLKRIFMSGYPADIIAHHGVIDDGIHFIQKPFSLTAMASMVRKVLDSAVA